MTDETRHGEPPIPSSRTGSIGRWVMGRAQQMLMEAWADSLTAEARPAVRRLRRAARHGAFPPAFGWRRARRRGAAADPMALMTAGAAGLGARGSRPGARCSASIRRRRRRPRTAASPRRNGATTRSSTPSAKTYLALVGQAARHRSTRSRASTPTTRHKLQFAVAELRRRDEPVELRADQPAGAQADDRDARRESAQGPRQHAQGHRRRAS